MTPKERAALIKAIWRSKHRDYRSTKGDETHPSVLWYDPKLGTCLVPLAQASDAQLTEIWDDLERFKRKSQLECSLCKNPCAASTAHRHQDTYIGECCWDERLRATE
jgi:hypothetical protein